MRGVVGNCLLTQSNLSVFQFLPTLFLYIESSFITTPHKSPLRFHQSRRVYNFTNLAVKKLSNIIDDC